MGQAMITGGPERFAELTEVHFGRKLSMQEAWDRVESVVLSDSAVLPEGIWVGSIGYEGYQDVEVFARVLLDAGVERLIDVRELPISRKRGFAKTALGAACTEAGIDYLHVRELGNPKAIRELFKSGRVEEGRAEYKQFLRTERAEALAELSDLLADKRTALMCVEHEASVCHRRVIFEWLEATAGLKLKVAEL